MKKRTTNVVCLFLLPLILLSFSLFSQTVVNDYNQVTVIGGSTATVTSLTGINGIHTLAIGDTVLIIQMQGATINESLTGFGPVTGINNAGKYEINVICGITGNTVAFKLSLVNTYTAPAGQVQIVTHGNGKLLTYTVPAGGVTATPWNGTVGGVVFIKANAITLNGPVTATGKGFRGGKAGGMPGPPATVCNKNVMIQPGNTYGWTNSGCDGAAQTTGVTDYYYPKYKLDIPTVAIPNHTSPPSPATLPPDLLQQYMGGGKGEGIAVYITDKETGRGSQANGGGGGQTHNSGGAGGGLFAQGGAGGKQWDIATPTGLVNGGIGGSVGMAPTSLKLFMGGGGGGGHANYPNGHASDGAIGGGIVLFRSVTLTYSSNQTISSDGLGNLGFIDSDSEGGGGSGGSIYFDVKTMTAGGVLTVSSKGGRGGDAINGGDCIGTGGGGAGGYILSKATFPGSTVKLLTGGISGVVTGVTNTSKPCYGAALSKWGATDGTNGTWLDAQSSYSIPMGSPISCSLPIEIASFTTRSYTDKVWLQWTTASEDNNNYFVIERSKDGIHFEEIGIVAGTGTSKQMHNYSYSDKQPYDGLSYYRLKQVDFDGHYSYSNMRSADLNSAYGITGIYPQPIQEDKLVNIHYLLSEDSPVSLKITDALGKETLSHFINSEKGLNSASLSLNYLPPGIYYLLFQTDDLIQSRKLLVE
jgi:hypothetical protein